MNTFRLAIFAGIAISIGGTVFLNIHVILGAVLFAFGLLTVVHYKLKLYTGTAGYVTRSTWRALALILLANIIGCVLTALLIRYTTPSLTHAADTIVQKRLLLGPLKSGLLAIPCGLIMTTAVEFARKQQFLPLLFGVPVFILCGFTHSIADAFYYSMASRTLLADNAISVLTIWGGVVLGNLAGCNIYRLFIPKDS